MTFTKVHHCFKHLIVLDISAVVGLFLEAINDASGTFDRQRAFGFAGVFRPRFSAWPAIIRCYSTFDRPALWLLNGLKIV